MMRLLIFLLITVSLITALRTGPMIYEQDDLGDIIFEEFVYSMSVDCTAATIRVKLMDEEYMPVEGATTFLKYVDFSSPLLSTVKSDKDGYVLHRLPGQTTLMRGLFILVAEKNGFRSKEVHFDISPCYTDYTSPVRPAAPIAEPEEENSVPEPPELIVDGPTEENITEEEPEPVEETAPVLCPGVLMLLLMFFKTMKI